MSRKAEGSRILYMISLKTTVTTGCVQVGDSGHAQLLETSGSCSAQEIDNYSFWLILQFGRVGML